MALWSDLRDMQRKMDLFSNFFTPTQGFGTTTPFLLGPSVGGTSELATRELGTELWLPSLDVRDTDKAMLVHVELPGIPKEDIKLTVEDNKLIVQGEKKFKHKEEGENWVRKERSYGRFYRAIVLPPSVNTKQIQANYNAGVLEITIPKSEEFGKRQTIDICEKPQLTESTQQQQPQTSGTSGVSIGGGEKEQKVPQQ